MSIKLVNESTGMEIKIGDVVNDFRGGSNELLHFYRKPAPSTGRVVIAEIGPEGERYDGREVYPSVIGAKIVEY